MPSIKLHIDANKKAQRKDLWKQPFEGKEYYQWYSVIEQAVRNCPQAKQYTVAIACPHWSIKQQYPPNLPLYVVEVKE